MFSFVNKISDLLSTLIKVVIVFCFSLLVGVVIIQVILRYVFNSSLGWAEEFARYDMIWISFLAAGLALKSGAHVSVEFIKNKVPGKLGKMLSILIKAGIFLFLFLMAKYGFMLAGNIWTQLSPAMELPMSIPYLAIPVGGVLMMFFLVESLLADFREIFRRGDSK